uniref:(northern house mosquito) hypothetical protein n=1 Tax=Culex pipiens TaxID=7175 RepID=A0A8D8G1N7_CULPI
MAIPRNRSPATCTRRGVPQSPLPNNTTQREEDSINRNDPSNVVVRLQDSATAAGKTPSATCPDRETFAPRWAPLGTAFPAGPFSLWRSGALSSRAVAGDSSTLAQRSSSVEFNLHVALSPSTAG